MEVELCAVCTSFVYSKSGGLAQILASQQVAKVGSEQFQIRLDPHQKSVGQVPRLYVDTYETCSVLKAK